MKFLIFYLFAINSYGIYVMYSDKEKARKGQWRISENRLFIVALLFGSLGIMVGMKKFRHKTQHYKFIYGIPSIFLVQLYLIYKLYV
ncbi:DUF1294 domain-containing protein [Clostridium bovifaecis]|uniref:DUF1294 domain-containing protein n=1 Tax=Clostridium bovifaecis TaxID=2184719 RepID=A0A6I6F8R3_9CLOT|nr:DUF1294 domain-containing protein [Clostridium bovifaecis]